MLSYANLMKTLRHTICFLLMAVVMGRAQQLQELKTRPETSPDYVITRWSMENGLPSDGVRAVVQTRDGYVWVATYNGLARFDGMRFHVYNDANTPNLKNRLINQLFEDARGRLWVGMDTGQIAWCDEAGFHDLPIKKTGWRISPIIYMADTTNDVLVVLNRDGQLLRIKNGVAGTPTHGPDTPLYSEIMTDAQNQVWAVRFGGAMQRLDADGGVTDSAGPPPERGYRNVAAARHGGFWVRDGLRLRRWDDGQWVEDRGVHSWGDDRPVVMREISTGEVLAGAGAENQGMFVVDETGREHRLTPATGLAHNWISSIWEDREKNVWLGLNGGGLQLLRKRALTMVTPADRWQDQPVKTVTPAVGGGVWVGTLGAGVYRFDGQHFQHLVNEKEPHNQFVCSVLEDNGGRLWIGSLGGGINWWKDGQYGNPAVPKLFPNLIYGLFEAVDGSIWASTQNGAARFAGDQFDWLATDLVQADVRCMVQARDGDIWLGMRGGGVARYHEGRFTQFMRAQGLPYEYVSCLCADDDGGIWIGTSGGGLARYRDGKFFNFTTRQGLTSDFICDIEKDERGNLWIASYGGIFRVDKGDLERCARGEIASVICLVLDISEGLSSLEMANGNQPAGCRTADGRLWFATSRGLAVVDPERINVIRTLPPVVLEEVRVDGTVVKFGRQREEVVVPPGSGQIEFRYTGLSFSAPKRVRFKYQMEGLDTDWVDADARRSAIYAHLPPGNFRFRVIACNASGYWNEAGAEIRVKILPHFWETWWFEPLCWLGGATLVGGAVISALRLRHRRKLAVLERAQLLERERARIAQDLHDDLGTGLTEIHVASALGLDPSASAHEVSGSLHEISQRARQMVLALDEIVWAVNPKNDNLGSLASYFCNFAEQFLRPANIACRLDVANELPATPLPSEKRHSLFLAFKEALNNVMRHSEARTVELGIRVMDDRMTIEVADDGRGFTVVTDHPGADGLANMRTRMQEMGGQFEFASELGKGTRVKFILPLRESHC